MEDYNGNPLFKSDLGAGYYTGYIIPCETNALGGNPVCTFESGNDIEKIPAKIIITNFGTRGVNNNARVRLAKIRNPRTAGQDVNVVITVYTIQAGVI